MRFAARIGRRGPGEVQRGAHPVGGDVAGQAERAADVLVVDDAVGERDPAAEAGGQAAGLQVVLDQGEQLVGAASA